MNRLLSKYRFISSKSLKQPKQTKKVKPKAPTPPPEPIAFITKTKEQIDNLATIKQYGLLRFIKYYHNHAQIAPPSSLTHKLLKTRNTTHVITIPLHTLANQQMKSMTIKAISNKHVANATQLIQTTVVESLIANVTKEYIDKFAIDSRSSSDHLSDQVLAPITINIPDDLAKRMTLALASTQALVNNRKPSSLPLQLPIIHDKQPTISSYRPRIAFHDQPIPNTYNTTPLPIHTQYSQILETIYNQPITIISAETGAGKTTQIPQFILSSYINNASLMQPPNIIITQPRKIAATSVAERVASERDEQIGVNSAIGHAVRFDIVEPTNTKNGSAVFCTTGVLLRKLQTDPLLKDVTHIILDEVHERDLNTDLLLSIITQIIPKRPDLRVVLMSATADTKLFQQYFRNALSIIPPVITIKGKCFAVTEQYLEHVQSHLMKHNLLSSSIKPFFQKNFSARSFEEKNMYLRVMRSTIEYICSKRPQGAILVFLPGWQEITYLKQELMKSGFNDTTRYKICTMHSSVPVKEQKEAFHVYDSSIRKIILATNIAETSITIKDIVYVVDSGLMKVNRYDSSKQLSSMQDEYTSQSNTRQRIGRAGRVQAGEYYSMLTSQTKHSLPLSITSEIQRSDLQSTVLNLKSMNLDATRVLNQTPEPPSSQKITDSLTRLTQLGAITSKGALTLKGNIMSKLPISPWLSNLIIQGVIYKCLDPLLAIAAIISTDRSPFAINPLDPSPARQYIRYNYAQNTSSDQVTALNAFQQFIKSNPNPASVGFEQYDLCFLKKSAILNIEKSITQYYQILAQTGVYTPTSAYDFNLYSNDKKYVEQVFGKCLYPNVGRLSDKNVYKGKAKRAMRLTGSSVNSYSAKCDDSSIEDTTDTRDSSSSTAAIEELNDIETIKVTSSSSKRKSLSQPIITNEDLDKFVWNYSSLPKERPAPTFPVLLAYQDLQQIESAYFMRNTSELSALVFMLMTPCWVRSLEQAKDKTGKFVELDGWLNVKTSKLDLDLNVLRDALVGYEDVVLSSLVESSGRRDVPGSELHSTLHAMISVQ